MITIIALGALGVSLHILNRLIPVLEERPHCPQGSQGPKGDAGPQGCRGPKGDAGSQGTQVSKSNVSQETKSASVLEDVVAKNQR